MNAVDSAATISNLSARCCRRLAVGGGAGGLGPVRKLDKISQNIKRLVALWIDLQDPCCCYRRRP